MGTLIQNTNFKLGEGSTNISMLWFVKAFLIEKAAFRAKTIGLYYWLGFNISEAIALKWANLGDRSVNERLYKQIITITFEWFPKTPIQY